MRIMQLDVNSIEFEPIEPEIKVHESAEKKKVSVKNALVLFTSIEKGDNEALASRAVKEAMEFAAKNKINSLVVYPFAHLSSELEEPQRSMTLFHYMVKEAEKSKLKIVHAPFGWTKALTINIKGHRLSHSCRAFQIPQNAGANRDNFFSSTCKPNSQMDSSLASFPFLALLNQVGTYSPCNVQYVRFHTIMPCLQLLELIFPENHTLDICHGYTGLILCR